MKCHEHASLFMAKWKTLLRIANLISLKIRDKFEKVSFFFFHEILLKQILIYSVKISQ